jgi:hypothetical protein
LGVCNRLKLAQIASNGCLRQGLAKVPSSAASPIAAPCSTNSGEASRAVTSNPWLLHHKRMFSGAAADIEDMRAGRQTCKKLL